MFIADLHLHSCYSRATSRDAEPVALELTARQKGLHLLATGDFTHPGYRAELADKLVPAEDGLYMLKPELSRPLPGALAQTPRPRFLVSGEISCIYKKNGRVRKVHNLILLPGLDAAALLSERLERLGNLRSDGRPILGLDSRDLLEITLGACAEAIFIPAHIWTPHFSLFGAASGFDTIEECYADLTPHIHALETGLSSDPPMNWRISALDRFTLVSNSDAHSPAKLAREANLFNCELSYSAMARALADRDGSGFAGTIEFFPEEGKYHYYGHRACHVCFSPAEAKAAGGVCPVCGGRLTAGVAGRTDQLSDREPGFIPPNARPYENLVPLPEVLAAAAGLADCSSVKVQRQYEGLLAALGPELFILRQAPLVDIERAAGPLAAECVRRLRSGDIEVRPGFDGEYGKVSILSPADRDALSGQTSLFGEITHLPPCAAPCADPALTPATGEGQAQDSEDASSGAERTASAGAEAREGLSHAQQLAATATEAAVAVLAGPGSGKTRTLVSRIAYLVNQRGVAPQRITAVTFTNKALAEMRERLQTRLGDKRLARGLHIGTFHALCLELLRSWGAQVSVIDEYEARSLVAELAGRLNITAAPRELLAAISRCKSDLTAPEGEKFTALFHLYNEELARFGALDFDDILLRVLERFSAGASLDKDNARFTHLLVDEFQDINKAQYQLIRAWGGTGESLFVIGDPDQSIYGFRGASARCFEQLVSDLPALRTIHLTDNYRSTPEIVAAALEMLGEPRRLSARRACGGRLRLMSTETPHQEAGFIAREISRLVGGVDMIQAHGKTKRAPEQRGFSDIAVLYRTNRQAELIEQRLTQEGVPCIVAGREDFLAEPELRAATAFFRFLLNPSDLLSLRRALHGYGLAGEAAEKLLNDYAAGRMNIAALLKLSARPSAEAWDGFAAQVEDLAARVRREKPLTLLQSYVDARFLGGVACLARLQETALLYPSMPELLYALALGEESDVRRSGGKKYPSDAVLLTTLHGAKGLEFPVVFLAGVRDGLIPLRSGASRCDEEEERRLFYVGMTRAVDTLYLLTSDPASPFISAIPAALTEQAAPELKRKPQAKQLRLFE